MLGEALGADAGLSEGGCFGGEPVGSAGEKGSAGAAMGGRRPGVAGAGDAAPDRKAPLQLVELFAGIGGLGLGLTQRPGIASLLAVERDAEVAAIGALNSRVGATAFCADVSSALEAMLRRRPAAGVGASAADVGISCADAAWTSSLNRSGGGGGGGGSGGTAGGVISSASAAAAPVLPTQVKRR